MPDCTIIPVLMYPDLSAAIDWLGRAFGFTERWRVGNHRAQLSLGDSAIAITGPVKTERGGAQRQPSPSTLLVRVPDVEQHIEHARNAGALIMQQPAVFAYGEKQYTARDIGGHMWTFSQSIADVAPEDWGGTTPRS